MVNTLVVFNTSVPGSVVYVPFLSDEPVYFVIDRISALLGENPAQFADRKLFVNGFPLKNDSKSIDHYRILGNGFSYRSHRVCYQVLVMTLTGHTLCIPCSPDETIRQIKDHETSLRKFDFSNKVPQGRVAGGGTNIECRCKCNKGKYLVICRRGYGLTEMTTVAFTCPLCRHENITPVTVGFTNCKFRVHGIKLSGEQYTSDWTTVTKEDRYARFNPSKQETWRRLVIESVVLGETSVGERCLMCLQQMDKPKKLGCGHHYHAECFQNWNRCPACLYNQHVASGAMVKHAA
ncbi:hypothetical protein BG000_003550 [Podila horticola]|nr:hypothetical protein BG000_003550 [Podila horticola]